MTILIMLPAMLSFLLMAAHWLRSGNLVLVIASLAMMGLLWVPRPAMRRVVQVLLGLAALVWMGTAWGVAQERMAEHEPWIRAAVILLVVAGFNLLAAGLLQVSAVRRWYLA